MAADRTTLAVDLGGTWLRVTTAARGARAAVRTRVGPRTTPAEIGHDLRAAALTLLGGPDRPGRIVVAVPTFPDHDGRLLDCPALPLLTGVSLAEVTQQAWTATAAPSSGGSSDASVPGPAPEVQVVPDIVAAALGEARQGAGRGARRVLCVALGTGANAALVVDGEVRDLAFGCLGDAGHVVVEIDGPPCTCGGRGCLEAVCSGWALTRDATALGYADVPAMVARAQADPGAAAVLRRAGTALGAAMATWSALTWPDVIAVAGGVARAGEVLLAPARAALSRHVAPYIGADIQVVVAELGEDAALVGALILAQGDVPQA